jgi:hypothetical protein
MNESMYKRKRRARSKTRGSILFLGRKSLVSYFVFGVKKEEEEINVYDYERWVCVC